jgi:hypothetical protein
MSDPSLDVPSATYDRIRRAIESDESPVGIDAQKAHVMILHKLIELEKRLDRLEDKLDT